MQKKDERKLTSEQVEAINKVTSRGDRAEVIPVKDGLKILRVRREAVHYQD